MRVSVAFTLMALAACDRQVDLVVDATDYAQTSGAVSLQVDVVAGGEIQERQTLDLTTSTTLRLTDAVAAGATHGVVAFADIDGDGLCNIEVDDGWVFVHDPVAGADVEWVVERDVLRDLQACVWFSGEAPEWDPTDG